MDCIKILAGKNYVMACAEFTPYLVITLRNTKNNLNIAKYFQQQKMCHRQE